MSLGGPELFLQLNFQLRLNGSFHECRNLIDVFFDFRISSSPLYELETFATWCMCVHAQKKLQDLRDLKEWHMWKISSVQNLHGYQNGTCRSFFLKKFTMSEVEFSLLIASL